MDWFDKLFISEVKGALNQGAGALPFGEKTFESVEWDGNLEGRTYVEKNYYTYWVHVSDCVVPTLEVASEITVDVEYNAGGKYPVDLSTYPTKDLGNGCYSIRGATVISIPNDSTSVNVGSGYGNRVFQKKGLYFMYQNLLEGSYAGPDAQFHVSKATFPVPIVIDYNMPSEHISAESISEALDELNYERGEDVTITYDRNYKYPYIWVEANDWWSTATSVSYNKSYTYRFYKVSEMTLVDEKEGKRIESILWHNGGGGNNEWKTYDKSTLSVRDSDGFIIVQCQGTPYIVSCPADDAKCSFFGETVFPEKGLYILEYCYTKNMSYDSSWYYVAEFTIPNKRYKIEPRDTRRAPVSYNDLTDRPFYDEKPPQIKFDICGDISDRVVVNDEANSRQFIHVSDNYIPCISSLTSVAKVTYSNQDTGGLLTSMYAQDGAIWSGDCWSIYQKRVVFISEDNCELSNTDGSTLVFPKKGVYFKKSDTEATVCVTFTKRMRKIIDPKFLPDHTTPEAINDAIDAKIETAISGEITELIDTKVADSLIINSSTEGSPRKFRIRIDDDGVLTAERIQQKTVLLSGTCNKLYSTTMDVQYLDVTKTYRAVVNGVELVPVQPTSNFETITFCDQEGTKFIALYPNSSLDFDNTVDTRVVFYEGIADGDAYEIYYYFD